MAMLVKRCPHCDSRFRRSLSFCPIDGTPLDTPEDPFLGLTIAGRYHVEEKLGAGGMASVYRARHQVIGRDVALKFLDPEFCEDPRQRRRFLGEARAANHIDHDHIIDISDYGETEDGLVYMVMEYLQGQTLATQIQEGPLSVARSLRIAQQVARGLARAHELGVVHRDVKPANIYLVNRNDRDFVKLLDFGVARIEQDLRITIQGTIIGTPEYIAPEQIRSAAATPATDMYALGCVLFEMLTGALPFSGNPTILLVKHLNEPVRKPSELAPGVPPAVDALVNRMMAKAPEQRHRDAYHLAEDLQKTLDELPNRKSAPSPIRPSLPARSQAPPAIPEEVNWRRMHDTFRELAAEVHGEQPPPSWLQDALDTMASSIADVTRMRAELEQAAKRATALEEDAREPRGQIGRALDELARDGSRIGRKAQQVRRTIAADEAHVAAQVAQLCADAHRLDTPVEPGAALTEAAAERLRRMLATIADIEQTNARLVAARERHARHLSEQKDLSFQIAQLKDQLGSLHRGTTLDQEVSHGALRALDARIQERLATLDPLARRITEHFKRFPAVSARLSERTPAA